MQGISTSPFFPRLLVCMFESVLVYCYDNYQFLSVVNFDITHFPCTLSLLLFFHGLADSCSSLNQADFRSDDVCRMSDRPYDVRRYRKKMFDQMLDAFWRKKQCASG